MTIMLIELKIGATKKWSNGYNIGKTIGMEMSGQAAREHVGNVMRMVLMQAC